MLDTGPLGKIAHPRADPDIAMWLEGHLRAGVEVIIPEIADYDLRRELLQAGLHASVVRLNEWEQRLAYLPLQTEVMRQAAEFWAQARKAGKPTADDKALDGDVILAAQAHQVGAVVATENVGHLSRFVDARNWKDIH